MNKDYIKYFLISHNILDYTINSDLSVNCYTDVNLQNHDLGLIPINFNIIEGDFIISYNNLNSLKNCPKFVYGDFSCRNNNLTTLKYCPIVVDGFFNCMNNNLTSLDYIPEDIDPEKIWYGFNDITTKQIDNFWEKRIEKNPMIFFSVMDKISKKIYNKYLYLLASRDHNLI